jgi:hypothetical protein
VETAPFGHLILLYKYYDRALFPLRNDEVRRRELLEGIQKELTKKTMEIR